MLHERIRETLDQSKVLDQRKLSKIAGATESSLSRFLNGLEDLNFASVLKIVQHLYPEEEKSIMADYVLTLKSRNARFALEYCDINSLEEQFTLLVEKLSTSVNPVDKEWARLYGFLKAYHQKKDRNQLGDLLTQIELLNPKEIEMKALKEILKSYIYAYIGDYSSLMLSAKNVEHFIRQFKTKFLITCFNVRLGLIMNYVCLYDNDLERSRYYSYLVLNQSYFEAAKGTAYQHLGHSYMFEDFDKSKLYMEEAMDLFRKFNKGGYLSVAKRNLCFLQSYWRKDREFNLLLENHEHRTNYIFYLIQKGEIELAKTYLNEIDVHSISNISRAFYYYYCGLINRRKDIFYHSVKYFQLSRDLFHIKLPLQELLELGEDEEVLSVWTT